MNENGWDLTLPLANEEQAKIYTIELEERGYETLTPEQDSTGGWIIKHRKISI